MTTGMPASTAFLIGSVSAAGSGMLTAMPSTLLSMAFWIRLACSGIDPEPLYLNSTLSLVAASVAPFWMTSKKVSPAGAWLIIAKVYCGVSTVPPPLAAPLAGVSLAAAPPLLLHAAVISSRPAAAPIASFFVLMLNNVVPSVAPGCSLHPVGRAVVGLAGVRYP